MGDFTSFSLLSFLSFPIDIPTLLPPFPTPHLTSLTIIMTSHLPSMVATISLAIISLLVLAALAPVHVCSSPVPVLPTEEKTADTYPIYVDPSPYPSLFEVMKKRDGPRVPIRTPPHGPGTGGTYDKNQPGNRR